MKFRSPNFETFVSFVVKTSSAFFTPKNQWME